MKIERFIDDFCFLLPSLAVRRRHVIFGWFVWHWEITWGDSNVTEQVNREHVRVDNPQGSIKWTA